MSETLQKKKKYKKKVNFVGLHRSYNTLHKYKGSLQELDSERSICMAAIWSEQFLRRLHCCLK